MPPIDSATRLCAVIGNPVEHSLSPAIHNAAFQAARLNYIYLAFRVEHVKPCLDGMRALDGFRGMSVTIPHKVTVMEHLDYIDPMALKVGSVNTVTRENGRLLGSTTDGRGALRAFHEAGTGLAGKNVLMLGAGGAVRAVAFAIAELERPARLTILGRNPERVQALVDDLAHKTGVDAAAGALAEDLPAAMNTHDVLIQGTPAGMYPDRTRQSLVPAALLRPKQVVFDMVYRPMETRLIREAKAAGCQTIPGLEMLLHQAALQFEEWTGMPAPAAAMRAALAAELERDLGAQPAPK